MAKVADRVRETATTTGTGDFTLAGAATGCITFNAAVGTNVAFHYCIQGQTGSEYEIGEGYLSGSTTLVRSVVRVSSNSNALVSFSAGTKDVFITYPASAAVTQGELNALRIGLAMQ